MKHMYMSFLAVSFIAAQPIWSSEGLLQKEKGEFIEERDFLTWAIEAQQQDEKLDENAQGQSFDRVKSLLYHFENILDAFDSIDVYSERYVRLMQCGIGLIETAAQGENGLTTVEKLNWYRALYDKHETATFQITDDASVKIVDGQEVNMQKVKIQLLAIKKVLITKISDLLKEYKNKPKEQENSNE